MTVKKGDKVKIDYNGTLEDGTVFDTSEGKQPIEFEVGSGMVIPGFDAALIGMKKGEEKNITLPPEKAYGPRNPDMLKKIPRDKLPADQEPKKGMVLMIGTQQGQFPAKIEEVGDKEITVDLNHPMSGKTLNFKLKVVEIAN